MSATLLECAARIARGGRPAILLRYGRSPGDSLLCSAILHELRARGVGPLWMQTDHPSLFERSPDVDLVVPYRRTVRRLVRLAGGRVVYPDYAPYNADGPLPSARDAATAANAGRPGRLSH